MSHPHILRSVDQVRQFALAGNATLTLVSRKTRSRFTYRVRGEAGKPHFVSLMRGSDNEGDYSFLGSIFESQRWGHGARSRVTPDAPSAVAFKWFWERLSSGKLPDSLEVWHEGRCGRCGRKLTVPESISMGLGPLCSGRV